MLKGAFVFMADRVRALDLPAALDFVGLSSYGSGTETCGRVRITKRLQTPIAGKDVLVVEDILDTGLSMRGLLDYLGAGRPRSVRIRALLDKRAGRVEAIPADSVGFALPGGFVVGYGIDHAERNPSGRPSTSWSGAGPGPTGPAGGEVPPRPWWAVRRTARGWPAAARLSQVGHRGDSAPAPVRPNGSMGCPARLSGLLGTRLACRAPCGWQADDR